MKSVRNARISEITKELVQLRKRIDALAHEHESILLAECRENHPCQCVKLNSDIGIFDSLEQEQEGRRGLNLGLVSKTLSASKNCVVCNGTGKPQ